MPAFPAKYGPRLGEHLSGTGVDRSGQLAGRRDRRLGLPRAGRRTAPRRATCDGVRKSAAHLVVPLGCLGRLGSPFLPAEFSRLLGRIEEAGRETLPLRRPSCRGSPSAREPEHFSNASPNVRVRPRSTPRERVGDPRTSRRAMCSFPSRRPPRPSELRRCPGVHQSVAREYSRRRSRKECPLNHGPPCINGRSIASSRP